MGRKKSKFWDYAEELKDNRFRCNFCKRDFSGGASRITAHLAGEKGNDIAICSEVPQDVKKRATEEIPSHNKKRKIALPSSSNVEENGTIFSQSIQEGAHIPSGHVPPTTALAGQTTDIRNDIEEAINTVKTGKDMGRKRSSYWEYAEDLKNNHFRFNFCKSDFPGGVSRIRAHLAGEKGHDIAICSKVPPDIQAYAYSEIRDRNKNRKIAPPSSSNVEENGTILLQFNDTDAFNTCVSPTNYVLKLEHSTEDGSIEGRVVMFEGCDIKVREKIVLPKDADFLKLCDVRDLRRLFDLLSLNKPVDLKKLFINWGYMESLFDVSSSWALDNSYVFSKLKVFIVFGCLKIKNVFMPWLLKYLDNLEEIHVSNCDELVETLGAGVEGEENDNEGMHTTIFSLPKLRLLKLNKLWKLESICTKLKLDERVASSPVPPGTFFQLQRLEMSSCYHIKVVFTPGMLLHLHNLEEIEVSNCFGLVEIIGASSEEAIDISLPKLRVLKLRDLPRLKSICGSSQLMHCDSIQQIEIIHCSKLKRLPLSLPLLNGTVLTLKRSSSPFS